MIKHVTYDTTYAAIVASNYIKVRLYYSAYTQRVASTIIDSGI